MRKTADAFTATELATRLSLVVLPVGFVVATLAARAAGGPFWLWFNLDPDYFYLLDALNLVNLTTPGHVHHPGIPVQGLGAAVLWLANLGASADAITDAVLADPESHLRLIGSAFVVVGALAMLALGWTGLRVFGDPVQAWILQIGPLISMLVVKSAYHVKPEALLTAATLALMTVAVAALDEGALRRHRGRFAVAFGVIAGFGVAIKVTAAPVFVLPLFVLGAGPGGMRAVVLYGAATAAALVLFTLPAAGAYDVMVGWIAKVAQGSGAYGGGEGFIDLGRYPAGVWKMLKRPALHLPLGLGLFVLVLARRRREPAMAAEARLLAGVLVAVTAQVLIVAKQPNALYLVPALVLSPLIIVLTLRLAGRLGRGRRGPALGIRAATAALLIGLAAAQGFAAGRLVRELGADRAEALAVTDLDFVRCARVHAYASSSPAFALLLGDYVTGSRFTDRLAASHGAGDYWLEHWWDQGRLVFRGWRGPEDMAAQLARYPCVVLRASHWAIIERFLPAMAPGLGFDARCSTRHETIAVSGAECPTRRRP